MERSMLRRPLQLLYHLLPAPMHRQHVTACRLPTSLTVSPMRPAHSSPPGALPAGVTGAYAGGVFTISGTPTAGGVFTYKVTTTGGCATATMQGTITVDAQKIVLTSGTASQTVCQAGTVSPVKFTISGKAQSATVSGLPSRRHRITFRKCIYGNRHCK